MPRPVFSDEDCSACGACVDACPNGVLEIIETAVEVINEEECVGCEACVEECPLGVIAEIEED